MRFRRRVDRTDSEMLEKPPQGLFIVGTDTGVGKTFVGCQLLRWLRSAGYSPGVYKPAESGFDDQNPEGSDAWRLWEAAGRPLHWKEVCPQRFAAPLAPDQAALREGRTLDSEYLREGLSVWQSYSSWVLVEGAGGILSPVSEEELVLDLASDLGYPLVLVVDDSIGAINRSLQAVDVIRRYRGGMELAGLVLSQTASVEDLSRKTNGIEIQKRTGLPILASLGFGDRETSFDRSALGTYLPQPI
jgi:dethiobiotin synthetase